MKSFFALASLSVALTSMTAVAWAKPTLTLTLSAGIVHNENNGKLTVIPVGSTAVKSGDRIRYDVQARNVGSSAASAVRPQDAIPAGTMYLAGSATGGKPEFSLDRGKSWSAEPTIVVLTKDGKKSVKADPSTFTAIRWTAPTPIRPGTSAHFTFDVAVK